VARDTKNTSRCTSRPSGNCTSSDATTLPAATDVTLTRHTSTPAAVAMVVISSVRKVVSNVASSNWARLSAEKVMEATASRLLPSSIVGGGDGGGDGGGGEGGGGEGDGGGGLGGGGGEGGGGGLHRNGRPVSLNATRRRLKGIGGGALYVDLQTAYRTIWDQELITRSFRHTCRFPSPGLYP
jgi:hypothetical protein